MRGGRRLHANLGQSMVRLRGVTWLIAAAGAGLVIAAGRAPAPGAAAAVATPGEHSSVAPSTQRMAQRLVRVTAAMDPMANPLDSRRRADLLRQVVAGRKDLEHEMRDTSLLAKELLNAGEPEA